ncbi:cell cycle control protein [Anaeramoeba flamelloides]|uniref:Cell cycle control protein n=1 Tax=Anaeramoeba flamelloides TaxID=1746091 RepID=A0ABQ8ZBB0_9EUKA|nr:cell cycle control protein [Anaeramoeba flamelloides]
MSQKEKPSNKPFKQQNLKAWQPLFTPKVIISSFYLLGFAFLIIAIIVGAVGSSVKTYEARYDDKCTLNETCTVDIDIEEDLEGPVYLMYELTNFYQNHRRYAESRSNAQLMGNDISWYQLEECIPRKTKDGKDDDLDEVYYPCGIIAFSRFNDSFSIAESGTALDFEDSDVAWDSDSDKKFIKNKDPTGIVEIEDVSNQHFIVWMRTAAFPTFRKLYSKTDSDLKKGTKQIQINNQYPSSQYDGEKRIIITNKCYYGGNNKFLAVAYGIVAAFLFVIAIIFTIKHIKSKPKPCQLAWRNF